MIALIEPNGERWVFPWPAEGGAHLHLTPEIVELPTTSPGSWLHTTGICLRASPARETILNTMGIAREAGLTVSVDLNLRIESWGLDSSTRKVFEQAIELSDVVFGNADEEIIPISGLQSLEAAASMLCAGKRIVISRQGHKGAFVTTKHEKFQAPAFPTEIVDTLGAGDAFSGGYIAASLAKLDLRDAVRWGNAVAAYKIGREGARGLPTRDELSQLLA